MAIWPFNRKKQENSDLPQEVQEYYQAEKRERVGVAGLLAVATLVITVLLAMGLFFGGRWVYRNVFDKDDKAETTQQESQDSQSSQPVGSSDENDGEQNAPEATPAPAPEPQPTSPTPAPPTTPTTTPVTGVDDLPSTGPADTAVIVLGTMIVGGAGYYLVRRPQEQ